MKKTVGIYCLIFALVSVCFFCGCGSSESKLRGEDEEKTYQEESDDDNAVDEEQKPKEKENKGAFPGLSNSTASNDDIEPEENVQTQDLEEQETEEPIDDEVTRDIRIQKRFETDLGGTYAPFYGVWISSSKNSDDASNFALSTYDVNNTFVVLSSEWDNLNPEPYYVVTMGKYNTAEEAKSALNDIKKTYSDAFVKFSGNYKLPVDSDGRFDLYCYGTGSMHLEGDKLVIEALNEDEELETYIVDADTVFDDSCQMEYFEAYEEGDTVLDWYKRVLDMPVDSFIGGYPLMGVFDISVTGDHVDKYYGSYWWD